jgi:hypothetical protein
MVRVVSVKEEGSLKCRKVESNQTVANYLESKEADSPGEVRELAAKILLTSRVQA